MECGLSLVVLVVVVVVCKLNLTILLVRVYLILGHFHSAGEHIILSHIKCNATFLCQKIVVINRVSGVVVGWYDFPVFRRLLISTFGIYVCKKRDNT